MRFMIIVKSCPEFEAEVQPDPDPQVMAAITSGSGSGRTWASNSGQDFTMIMNRMASSFQAGIRGWMMLLRLP
ncbi:MAG TPA: hypothetical protein VFM48_15860, partial [Aquabacterium sp.]|nr:hypothetical protein [Aquabacterium sp.]